jgi:thiazole/oxazole-forming peptide maturase SagD family component
VRALLDSLEKHGVLVESRLAALPALKLAENPMRFAQEVSDDEASAMALEAAAASLRPVRGARWLRAPRSKLSELLQRRRSVRAFTGGPIDVDDLVAVLWAAYGVTSARSDDFHKTVASGGALFPLRFHVVVLDRGGRLQPGVYAVHFGRGGKVGLKRVSRDWRPIYRAYRNPELLRYAHAVVVVSGDFQACARKYANRALLYVPLEGGHAVQNALVAAAERKIGAVQIGGFIDERVRGLIGAAEGVTPLSTVLLGVPAARAPEPEKPCFEFEWIDLGQADAAPFFLGMTRLSDSQDSFCWGRDPDPLLAYDKAASEAFERLACITPAGVVRAPSRALEDAVDPRDVLSYSPRQHARHRRRFRPFDPRSEYWWKAGTDCVSGARTHVLAELVYYGPKATRVFAERCYAKATSSGVAAHVSQRMALERALLELVERDAFMRAWLHRAATPQIALRACPEGIQRRLRDLQRIGARVAIKSLPSDFASVVLVFAQLEAKTLTAVAAAADYEPAAALDKALMEAESAVWTRLQSGRDEPIRPAQVVLPKDHAALYAQRRYFQRADFLAAPRGNLRLSEIARGKPRHLDALLARLAGGGRRVVQIDVTPSGAALGNGRIPLHVVRAVVPGLLPISFGFDCEPLGSLRLDYSKPLFPHPFF